MSYSNLTMECMDQLVDQQWLFGEKVTADELHTAAKLLEKKAKPAADKYGNRIGAKLALAKVVSKYHKNGKAPTVSEKTENNRTKHFMSALRG